MLFYIGLIRVACSPCGLSFPSSANYAKNAYPAYCNGNTPTQCAFIIDDALVDGAESSAYRSKAGDCLRKYVCEQNCYEEYSVCKKVSFDDFYYKLNCYLWRCYQSCIPYETAAAIWKCFCGDFPRIVIFITHCIHNTSGFKYLTGENNPHYSPYISRGILQILGKQNYMIAGYEYVHYPEKLASLDVHAVYASINVYNRVVSHHGQHSLCDSWLALNPVEVQNHNYLLDCYQKRIVDRLNVYLSLCRIFCIRPKFGNCYFIKRYLDRLCYQSVY